MFLMYIKPFEIPMKLHKNQQTYHTFSPKKIGITFQLPGVTTPERPICWKSPMKFHSILLNPTKSHWIPFRSHQIPSKIWSARHEVGVARSLWGQRLEAPDPLRVLRGCSPENAVNGDITITATGMGVGIPVKRNGGFLKIGLPPSHHPFRTMDDFP